MFNGANSCYGRWVVIEDGEAKGLPNTQFDLPKETDGVRHFNIKVEGNTYTAKNGGELIYDGFPSGKIFIYSFKEHAIDNFVINPLNEDA